LEHEVIVKRRRSQDRLGERSRVGELAPSEGEVDSWASGNSVERFGPEVVGIQTEARDGGLVAPDSKRVRTASEYKLDVLDQQRKFLRDFEC
jgi:hypothetical protein